MEPNSVDKPVVPAVPREPAKAPEPTATPHTSANETRRRLMAQRSSMTMLGGFAGAPQQRKRLLGE